VKPTFGEKVLITLLSLLLLIMGLDFILNLTLEEVLFFIPLVVLIGIIIIYIILDEEDNDCDPFN